MTDRRVVVDIDALPTNPEEGSRPVAWWGTWLFIATEAMIFAALISSYFFLRFGSEDWPLGGIEPPELLFPAIGTGLLFASSVTAQWSERSIARSDASGLRLGLGITILLGCGFLGIQAHEYATSTFGPGTNAYGSIFFGVTGFHGFHLLVGIAILTAVLAAALRPGRYTADHHLPIRLAIIYWHFVDVVWIVVFTSLYLSERLS